MFADRQTTRQINDHIRPIYAQMYTPTHTHTHTNKHTHTNSQSGWEVVTPTNFICDSVLARINWIGRTASCINASCQGAQPMITDFVLLFKDTRCPL